jgi:hypothetical protein
MVAIVSEYGYWPYVFGVLFFITCALIIFLIPFVCIVRGLLKKFVLRPMHMKIFSVAICVACSCLFTAIAFAAGFWVIPTAAAAVLDAVLWTVASPLVVLFCSADRFHQLVNPSAYSFGTSAAAAAAVTKQNSAHVDRLVKADVHSNDSDFELELLAKEKAERQAPTTVTPNTVAVMVPQGGLVFARNESSSDVGGKQSTPSATGPASNSNSPGGLHSSIQEKLLGTDSGRLTAANDTTAPLTAAVPPSESPAPMASSRVDFDPSTPPLRRTALLIAADLKTRPLHHLGSFLAGLFGAAMLILLIHNSCVCNKPQSMSTWASRSTKTTLCPADGSACHTYIMLGDDCSTLTAVSHYVEANGFIPSQAHAETCRLAPNATAASDCVGDDAMQPGVVIDHANLLEDMRYIAHVPLLGLQCGATYRVQVVFSAPGSTAVARGATICTHTTARATATAAGTLGVPAFEFIGGGDYVPKTVGKDLLRMGVQAKPNAAFAFVGGDLGYANNMRTCYMRIDQMLKEWSDALRYPADQCYQWAGPDAYDTAAQRAALVTFFFRYYPSQSLKVSATDDVTDWTRSSNTRLLGGILGMTVVDTGHVRGMGAEQTLYLQNSLEHFRNVLHVPAIVLYHVPAHPSIRNSDGGNSADVRQSFGGVLDNFDDVVTLVFENHDHAYKRTHRLRGESIVSGDAAPSVTMRAKGRGIVYTGDGALGANDPTDSAAVPGGLGATSRSTNYIYTGTVYTNGSIASRVIGQAGDEIDAFLAL